MKQMHKVLLMGLLLGTSFPVSKFAISVLGVWQFRLLSSSSALLGLAIVFRKELRGFLSSAIDLRGVGKLALLAVPNIFLVPTLNNFALAHTKASNAVILVYVMPPLLSVIQMVADRRLRLDSIAAALLSMAGIGLLLRSATVGVGEVLILLSAVVWAFGTFLAGRVGTQFPVAITTIVQYLTSLMLVVLCFALAQGGSKPAVPAPSAAMLASAIALTVYVGFIANAIVFHFWFVLIRERGAEYVAYSGLISLVVGTVTSIVVLREPPSVVLLVSMFLILSSVYIVQCRRKPAANPVPAMPSAAAERG